MTGFVLLRVRAHRLLLAAALLTVLLTTCVLATFTAFTGAIGDAALRRTLQHQAAGQATVEVQSDLNGTTAAAVDKAVRGHLSDAFAGLPTSVHGSTRSGPYGLPRSPRTPAPTSDDEPDLTLLATFDRAQVRLVEGRWPAAAGRSASRVQVAVPQVAAQDLGASPGDVLTLADRLGGAPLTIQISGVFQPRDPASPYWHLDPLGGRGAHTVAFTTYGPMLADPGTFDSGRVTAAAMSWQATGDFRHAGARSMDRLENGVRQTLYALHDDQATSTTTASSGLPDLLDALRRSMLVTRSTLLIGALQLVILAGFALLLVAGLLAEERAGETALLRARGGSRARVARLAGGEALLLAVPAAVVAPLLAGPVTRGLAGTGAMARTGVSLGSGSTGPAWLVALAAALACACAVIVPALRTGGPGAVGTARARLRSLPGGVQAGADIGLLIVAGIAYWQLDRRASGSGALSTNAGGGLGVDPILVAAPALCLLAGTMLVLRLLPLVAKLGERRAARGRALPLALAGWQLARRPRRGAGAALLLVLAIAMGVFSIGQSASWDRSQRDQAQYAVGADLRVTGMTTPPFGQPGIFAHQAGIAAAAPAGSAGLLLDQNRTATVLAIDSARAGKAMRFRSDLTGGRSAAEVLAPLREGVRAGGGFALPADARKAGFEAVLRPGAGGSGESGGSGGSGGSGESGGPGGPGGSGGSGGSGSGGTGGSADPGGAAGTPGAVDHVGLDIVDADGVPYSVPIGDVPADGRPHPLVLDIASLAGAADGAPAGPLLVTGLSVGFDVPDQDGAYTLAVSDARVTDAAGTVRTLAVPTQQWSSAPAFDDPSLAQLPRTRDPQSEVPRVGGGATLALRYDTGAVQVTRGASDAAPTATVQVRANTPEPPAVSGVATDAFLASQHAKVGGSVTVQLGGVQVPVRVAGSVRAIPGLGDGRTAGTGAAGSDGSAAGSGSDGSDASDSSSPGSDADGGAGSDADQDVGGVIVDLRAVNQYLRSHDGQAVEPTEWWIAARPGATARTAAALRARTDVDTVLVADETAADLRSDPLGAGPQSALPAAVVAAVVLAALGFAVSSAGAVRERTAEFAVLRALGAPRRQLARVIAAEQGLLVLVSLVVGAALGALLTRLVTPLIVLTPQATTPVPPLVVRLPAGRLLELLAEVVVVPVLVVLATAVRRGDPATALRRQGED
ncbi:putative membrane protein [Actinacidiphila reveromycinica]|uniref:Putative membrane protein n=1 Tax=Actinacidiphila reveromycinica TaxID=659352 RepID=A0A7U3URM1_9ACTN|nr:FtsX-like permease family protein [Streptomyces sp. SN-593]BBA97484.1 putative membrane protein [Streptomyces sp. SN-593]